MSETGNMSKYQSGRCAYHSGVALEDNPYQEDTDNYLWWLWGWVDARDKENWLPKPLDTPTEKLYNDCDARECVTERTGNRLEPN